MIPTMELRWLVRCNTVTSADVRERQMTHCETVSQAKLALVNAKAPVLQQWFEVQDGDHDDYVKAGGEWRDIEIVVLPNVE